MPAPSRPPTEVRSQLVGPLLAYLRATGHDPAPLVERFGLPANAASLPEVSLPLTTLHAFLDAAEALSGDAFLGLHVAQRVPRGTYGLVEYIARASPTVRDTFRVLASFDPPRGSLRGAPWEQYVSWAISQGLAPLAAYNLQYRLAGSGVPEGVMDRLMAIYQGSANDNVMKLVNFKQIVDDLQGRKLVLFGGAAFADTLYPHVAFRPVTELQLLMKRLDVDGFAGYLANHEFKPEDATGTGATKAVSDGRTVILLYSDVLGAQRREQAAGILDRALPIRVYGSSIFRADLEDAVLLTALEHARQGYEVPWLSFIDLRELVTGAQAMGGAYSRPLDVPVLLARAAEWRLERALYTSLAIVARLFPEAAPAATAAYPPLRRATRELLDRTVVGPISTPGQATALKGLERVRRLLTGQ
nr:nucleotidyltransferase family protein [Pyxidicoccus fallax]